MLGQVPKRWRDADAIIEDKVLSTFTVVAFEIRELDISKLDPASSVACGISSAYCGCMSSLFGMARERIAVTPEPDIASDVIYLSGPWGRLGWAGESILAIAAGHKWGVFLADMDARIDVVRNAYCVAKSLNSAKALIFDSGGMALELASDGRPFEEVIAALGPKPLFKRFCMTSADDVAGVATEMGLYEDADYGYFEIHFQSAAPRGMK